MSIFAAVANASASAAPAAKVRAPRPVDDSDLLFNINLFLLCAVAVFVLSLLPRATIRFTHKREWVDGHFLRSSELLDEPAAVIRRPAAKQQDVISPISPALLSRSPHEKSAHAYAQEYKEKWASETDASHTYVSHADLIRKGSSASTTRFAEQPELLRKGSTRLATQADLFRKGSSMSTRERRRQNVPTHMPGVSTTFPRLASFLRTTIRPGLTIGKGCVLLGYFAIMLYAGLFKSNPLSDPLRTGFVAVSQIPAVVLLGTKHNLLGMVIGFGYERLNYFHRFAGRVFVLAANIHAIGFFYSWTIAGTFTKRIASPSMQWATVALICADLLLLLSTDFMRQKFYNAIFIPSHIVCAVLLLVAVCFHVTWAVPYVLVATGIYGFDRVMRLMKSRVAIARLLPLPDLGMTRVEIRDINAGWRTGQHVRLRVLSWGMGWRQWSEAHPFTIASVSRCPSGEGLVLMVKKAGDWTNKLYEIAQKADYTEANGLGGKVQVVVEGPYGGPGHAIFASFSGAMFVAGGSGITFALAAVQDLMKKDLEERSRIRAMELVWCIQDPTALTPLVPLFSALIAQSQESYASLKISVFYTRAPPNPEVLKTFRHLPPGLTLSPARPKLPQILKGVVNRSAALFSGGRERKRGGGGLTGVIVGVCGPSGLGDEVRKAVAGFDPDSRKRVGGIELHEEAFGW